MLLAESKKIIKLVESSGLEQINADKIVEFLEYANKRYCQGKPIITDDLFDLVKAHLEIIDPANPFLQTVGARIAACDHRKSKLPYYMGSMNKIKSDGNTLTRYITTHPGAYLVMDKLDGISALLQYKKDGSVRLYTRGDGTHGQDITDIIPHIKGVPESFGAEYTVRGELIISRKDFTKYKSDRANARNMVSGLISAKKPELKYLSLVQFVVYSQLFPEHQTPSEQMERMKKQGFQVVHNILISEKDMSFEELSNILVDRKKSSQFEVDGIVISHDKAYPIITGQNPSHSFAFKNSITEDMVEVIVTGVEWNLSSHGYLKPTVLFDTVSLNGVNIQRATGFHGEYIKTNVIGVGARVLLTRSGDVIPHIVNVVSPSSNNKPLMPTQQYEWTRGGKDIKLVVSESGNAELEAKQVVHFFTTLKVTGFGPGNIQKVVNEGFDTVSKILRMTPKEFATVPGIDKNAQTFHDAIKNTVNSTSCVVLMKASNMFGRGMGETKLQKIVEVVPRLFDDKYTPTVSDIEAAGIKDSETIRLFLEGLQKFRVFARENQLNACKPQSEKPVVVGARLADHVILMTGFRNAELEDKIKEQGGRIVSAFSGKVTIVLTNSLENTSSKIKKAQDNGVRVMVQKQFEKEFKL